jgi:hypothetical protein
MDTNLGAEDDRALFDGSAAINIDVHNALLGGGMAIGSTSPTSITKHWCALLSVVARP